jgi:hypothetical protein
MNRLTLSTLLIFIFDICCGQPISTKEANTKLSTIFKVNQQKTEVLLLGTFHFAYPDLDGYKTPDSLRIDILSRQRQKEVSDVIAILKRFNPTKIAIEAMPEKQGQYDSLYRQYLSGNFSNERDERFQLGFRLAKELKHRSVYCIDARPFVKTIGEIDSALDEKYNLNNDTIFAGLDAQYDAFYNYDDTLQKFMSLKDYLLLINSEKYLQYENGKYLTYVRKGTALEPTGADGFISKWFNRNARIFSNIQRMADNKKERILVIFGGGHIPILQFLALSSQELKLRQFSEFVK